MSELVAGTQVAGRYSVVRLLGEGATKKVYLAWDRLGRTQVALAMLQPPNGDPAMGARFSREGRVASALRSPFIVRVLDVGKVDDGTRYLVTEAVLGRSLAEPMRHGPVAPALAVRWTLEVLAALSEAHGRGILHRDVKPENVLLARADDGEERVRLTDFGLAKVLDGSLDGSVALRTEPSAVMGTPEYMSPEQWRGAGVDARADLYSAGVMLYEMLTGRAPFKGPGMAALCVQHSLDPLPAFSAECPPEVRALEAVVRCALEKKADARYPTADAMREALERASGARLSLPAGLSVAPSALDASACVELVSSAWTGAIQVLLTPRLVLGREGHVAVRCLPPDAPNAERSLTVSREHCRIEWRGGRGVVVDLGSRAGTRVNSQRVDASGTALRPGDELSLGPHARMRFDHAPTRAGVLPAWARLARTDDYGAGQVHVLLLTEAEVSASDHAAIRVSRAAVGDHALRLRAVGEAIMVAGGATPRALVDGETLTLGALSISVAARGPKG